MSEAEKAVQKLRSFLAKDCNISRRRICSPIGGGSDDIENVVLFFPIQLSSLEKMGPRAKALFEALCRHLEDQSKAYGGFVFDPRLIIKLVKKVEKALERTKKPKQRSERSLNRSLAQAHAMAFDTRHSAKKEIASGSIKPELPKKWKKYG